MDEIKYRLPSQRGSSPDLSSYYFSESNAPVRGNKTPKVLGMQRAYSMLQNFLREEEDDGDISPSSSPSSSLLSFYLDSQQKSINDLKKYYATIGVLEKLKDPVIDNVLFKTGDSILVWGDKGDPVLGIGQKGDGENVVGNILTQYRDAFQSRNRARQADLINIPDFDDYIIHNPDIIAWITNRMNHIMTSINIVVNYMKQLSHDKKDVMKYNKFFITLILNKLYSPCEFFASKKDLFKIPPVPDFIVQLLLNNKHFKFDAKRKEELEIEMQQLEFHKKAELSRRPDKFMDIGRRKGKRELSPSVIDKYILRLHEEDKRGGLKDKAERSLEDELDAIYERGEEEEEEEEEDDDELISFERKSSAKPLAPDSGGESDGESDDSPPDLPLPSPPKRMTTEEKKRIDAERYERIGGMADEFFGAKSVFQNANIKRLQEYFLIWNGIVGQIFERNKKERDNINKINEELEENYREQARKFQNIGDELQEIKTREEVKILDHYLALPRFSPEKIEQQANDWLEANRAELQRNPITEESRMLLARQLKIPLSRFPKWHKKMSLEEMQRLVMISDKEESLVPRIYITFKNFWNELHEPKFSMEAIGKIKHHFIDVVYDVLGKREKRERYTKEELDRVIRQEKQRESEIAKTWDKKIAILKKTINKEFLEYSKKIFNMAQIIWDRIAIILYVFFYQQISSRGKRLKIYEFTQTILKTQYELSIPSINCGELLNTEKNKRKELISCVMMALINMIQNVNAFKAIIIPKMKEGEFKDEYIPVQQLDVKDITFATALLMNRPIKNLPTIFTLPKKIVETEDGTAEISETNEIIITSPIGTSRDVPIGDAPQFELPEVKVIEYEEEDDIVDIDDIIDSPLSSSEEEVDVLSPVIEDEEFALEIEDALASSPQMEDEKDEENDDDIFRGRDVRIQDEEDDDDAISSEEDFSDNEEFERDKEEGSDVEFGWGESRRRQAKGKSVAELEERRNVPRGTFRKKKSFPQKKEYLPLDEIEISNIKEKIKELNIENKGDVDVLTQHFINCCIYVMMNTTPNISLRINSFL